MKKRILAFLLLVCLLSGAALAAGYTDQADIDCAEAVAKLSEMGVLQGDPDGAFRPDDTLTRAEAVKMLFALEHGTDDASSYADVETTFTDLIYDWYQGYIKWAWQAEIIAGHSAEIFAPEGQLTCAELAKMLLVFYGEDAGQLTGTDWEETAMALAREKGYLADIPFAAGEAITRQWAAQMIFQAIPEEEPDQPEEPEEPEMPDRTRFTLTGYILDDGTSKLSPTDLEYVEFPVWNGEQVWELCLDPETLEGTDIQKGAFVQLENYAWGYRFDAADVEVFAGVAGDSSLIGAVKSYEPERDLIVLRGENEGDPDQGYPLKEDAAVIGIDTEEPAAVEGADVSQSDTDNVLLVLDEDGWVTAIFVDVQGQLKIVP